MNKVFVIVKLSFIFILSFGLYACKNDVTSIEVDQNTLENEYLLDEFNLEDIELILTRSDGTSDNIPLDSSMIDDEDLEMLKEQGVHNVEVNFKGNSALMEVTLLEESRTNFFDNPKENTLEKQYDYNLIDDKSSVDQLFFDMNFPLGLGMPQLSQDEIQSLVGQSVEVLKESITTVYDLYAYLLAANFNEDFHDEAQNMDNWYYSSQYETSYFIFESAELALAMNTAACAGLANIAYYILEDDYDDIGFLWFYAYDQGGHSFNYIEHQGLIYIIDFTQFKGIWQEDIEWFNLDRFPVIYKDVEEWIDFNIKFRSNNQNSETDFYAVFDNHNSYIPNNHKYWDLENSTFYEYDSNLEEPMNRYVRFDTQHDLLEALGLDEDALWFPDSIDLDEKP